MNLSNSRAFVDAIHPRVAIMNNGAHKAGSPEAWQTVHESPGLEDLYMLHTAEGSDAAHNSAEDADCQSERRQRRRITLRWSASTDGSFTVTNSPHRQDEGLSSEVMRPLCTMFESWPASSNARHARASIIATARRTHVQHAQNQGGRLMSSSRREFLAGLGAAGALAAVPHALVLLRELSIPPFRHQRRNLRRISITPARWPQTISACTGSRFAACGERTSRDLDAE